MTNPNWQNPQQLQPVVPGDPFSAIKKEAGPKGLDPRSVALIHARDDVDSSSLAHHHTIGIKHDQASAGDHVHDGASSRKIGAGMNLTLTGAKAGNVALTNLIAMLKTVMEFTDTTT